MRTNKSRHTYANKSRRTSTFVCMGQVHVRTSLETRINASCYTHDKQQEQEVELVLTEVEHD